MSTTLRTSAIVLRKYNVRECDRFLILYTREYGKIEASAKGACKIKSKLAGHLEPFAITKVMLARGKGPWQLIGAENEKVFFGIRNDIYKMMLGNYCAEVLEKISKSEHKDERIFSLFSSALEAIEGKKGKDSLFFISRSFVLKLLSELGYEPQVYECVVCRGEIKENNNFFSFEKGGVVCPRCRHGISGLPISSEAIKIIRSALAGSPESGRKILIKRPAFEEVKNITDGFLCFRLERKINCGEFLQYL